MKKIFYILFLFAVTLCVKAQTARLITSAEKIIPTFSNDDLKFSDSNVDVLFFPDFSSKRKCYLLGVRIYNNTDKRIYVEWENARMQGSKVIFEDDSPLSASRTKEDEVIISGEKSEYRKILPKKNLENGLSPFWSGGYLLVPVIIPIRFQDEVKDYKFVLEFKD